MFMSPEPEYTLEQAVRLLRLQTKRGFRHTIECKKCSPQHDCEEAKEIEQACIKWDQRVKELATRDGVKIPYV